MKHKLSISIDKKTLEEIEGILASDKFRNKSHLVEFAVNKFLKYDKQKDF